MLTWYRPARSKEPSAAINGWLNLFPWREEAYGRANTRRYRWLLGLVALAGCMLAPVANQYFVYSQKMEEGRLEEARNQRQLMQYQQLWWERNSAQRRANRETRIDLHLASEAWEPAQQLARLLTGLGPTEKLHHWQWLVAQQ